MKYHSQLIKKYISVNDNTENIANNLILKTVEIEEIIERNISQTIVIGKILSAEKHPDSDHLNICQVDCWTKGQFQIVCGANNVQAGLFVPVALEGTEFKKAGITIAKRKLRGVESNGMICSKGELEINEDTDQPRIWDLSKDLDVNDEDLWSPLSEKYEWLNSFILDVDNKGLTNRPDLTGHFGVAWELNAMYFPQGKINYSKLPDYKKTFSSTNIFDLLEHNEKKAKKQVISETQWLNNYILLEINNVNVNSSDFFLRLQNSDLGNSSINNWVDFSNIFMNISGHPVHFFDADKVEGNIIVRNAYEWEEFTDLFGKTHKLIPQDIVIADEKKSLCLWGIMGGLNSWVTEQTKNILIEIANFNPVTLRKTGVRLGLRTDSELRNEKNINPNYSLQALHLLLDELKFYEKSLWNFEIGGISYYIKPDLHPISEPHITVDRTTMEKFIFGEKVENFSEKAKEILKALWFEINENTITPALWRGPEDITMEADITEEVARIWWYEQVKNTPAKTTIENQTFKGLVQTMRQTEQILVDKCRATQVESYPWISEKMIQWFDKKSENFMQLQNPVNPECPLLRDSFIYQFIQIASKNAKFFEEIFIFDTGKIRTNNIPNNNESKEFAVAHIDEQMHTGILLYKKNISSRSEDTLLEAKGIIQTLLHGLGLHEEIGYESTQISYFHPKKQGKILYQGKEIGIIGAFHPLILKNNKLPENANTCFIELNQQTIQEFKDTNGEKIYDYETIQDQILWRDLSFVLDEKQNFTEIINNIKSNKEIKDLKVFDIYQGENLPLGKKSISIKIKIMGDGTMTTEQINDIMQKAIKAGEKTGAELRG